MFLKAFLTEFVEKDEEVGGVKIDTKNRCKPTLYDDSDSREVKQPRGSSSIAVGGCECTLLPTEPPNSRTKEQEH